MEQSQDELGGSDSLVTKQDKNNTKTGDIVMKGKSSSFFANTGSVYKEKKQKSGILQLQPISRIWGVLKDISKGQEEYMAYALGTMVLVKSFELIDSQTINLFHDVFEMVIGGDLRFHFLFKNDKKKSRGSFYIVPQNDKEVTVELYNYRASAFTQ